MGTRDERGAELNRRLGWIILGGVWLSWAILALWVALHPCRLDCSSFYWFRPLSLVPAGAVVWALSLGGLPVGAWLIESSYGRERPGGRPSPATAALAAVLYFLGFVTLLLSALSLLWLLRSATGAILPIAGVFWFALIGISTLVAARRLNSAVYPTRARDPQLWVAAGVVWLVGAVVPNVYAALVDNEPPFGEQIGDVAAEPPPVTDPSPDEEPTPTLSLLPTALPTLPRAGLLPVTVTDEASGYDMLGRIEFRPSGQTSLGKQYTVVLDGNWTAPGEPQDQIFSYTFFDALGGIIHQRSAPFGFYEGGHRIENLNHLTFFASEMHGIPGRAEIVARDANGD